MPNHADCCRRHQAEAGPEPWANPEVPGSGPPRQGLSSTSAFPPHCAQGGVNRRHFVVLFAALIVAFNLYVYFVPDFRRSASAGQGLRPAEGPADNYQTHEAAPGPLSGFPARKMEEVGERQGDKSMKTKRDPNRKKNVLFIMTDDLRPSLSIYDKPVITPAFDRLAEMGVVFERAYNQDPICNPSRNSLLSGRRPDTSRVRGSWLACR
jgi:hypothetical protein